MVQYTSGTAPTTTFCAASNGIKVSGPGLIVKAGQTLTINPSPDFNGALTAILASGWQGVRNEVNYQGATTWYDADYQLGMSDGTLGPASHQPQADGRSSLAGEQDCVGKANAAWAHTNNKAALLAEKSYIGQATDGSVNHVYMDSAAPGVVVDFFQHTADFNGYLYFNADHFTSSVATLDMEIIAY